MKQNAYILILILYNCSLHYISAQSANNNYLDHLAAWAVVADIQICADKIFSLPLGAIMEVQSGEITP